MRTNAPLDAAHVDVAGRGAQVQARIGRRRDLEIDRDVADSARLSPCGTDDQFALLLFHLDVDQSYVPILSGSLDGHHADRVLRTGADDDGTGKGVKIEGGLVASFKGTDDALLVPIAEFNGLCGGLSDEVQRRAAQCHKADTAARQRQDNREDDPEVPIYLPRLHSSLLDRARSHWPHSKPIIAQ